MRIGITERGDAGLDQTWRAKLASVDGAILITKAPHLLLAGTLPTNTIIHCTITGLGGTQLEPRVERPDVMINAYRALVTYYGAERVVLRIDPVIPQGVFLDDALTIMREACSRVRVSFLDGYEHIRERFRQRHITGICPWTGLHAPLDMRLAALRQLEQANRSGYAIEICGEPGMACTGCVSARDLAALGLDERKVSGRTSGQRGACCCLAEKVELLNNKKPCLHNCSYCYWVGSM